MTPVPASFVKVPSDRPVPSPQSIRAVTSATLASALASVKVATAPENGEPSFSVPAAGTTGWVEVADRAASETVAVLVLKAVNEGSTFSNVVTVTVLDDSSGAYVCDPLIE